LRAHGAVQSCTFALRKVVRKVAISSCEPGNSGKAGEKLRLSFHVKNCEKITQQLHTYRMEAQQFFNQKQAELKVLIMQVFTL
jgi:hypothetical protein